MRLSIKVVMNPGPPNLPEVFNERINGLSWLFEGNNTPVRMNSFDAHVWLNTSGYGSMSLNGEDL